MPDPALHPAFAILPVRIALVLAVAVPVLALTLVASIEFQPVWRLLFSVAESQPQQQQQDSGSTGGSF